MIESPVLQKWRAEAIQEVILDTLKHRFHSAPRDVIRLLRDIMDDKKLKQLNRVAYECQDIQEFREALLA